MTYLAILGRQPEIGIAELESLLGAQAVAPISKELALLTYDSPLPFARFGSVIKFAEVTNLTLPQDGSGIATTLFRYISEQHPYESGVKLKIGISDYSGTFSANSLNKLGLSLKKELKRSDYSVRIVPNKSAKLGSAQVIHNNLTAKNGIECVVFKNNGKLQLAINVYEQDIEAYTARDQARPMRDAKVGMLPPKLAQTIINLATGPLNNQKATILDPFCGTGVILQEALLMGYDAYGTDLEPRMIEYSNKNIQWLKNYWPQATGKVQTAIGDASSYTWQQPIQYIAAETYLGRPLSSLPSQRDLVDLVQSVNTLHKKVLQNIHQQITSNARICLAVPAWRTKNGFVHLPILDQLDKMGYNQLVFSQTNAKNLIYARADQIVARQLVVMTKR